MQRDQDMSVVGPLQRDDVASTGGVRWLPEESAIIMKIEVQALSASTPDIMAQVAGWRPATKHPREYKVV